MIELKEIPPHLEKFFTKKQKTKKISAVNLYVWHTLLWLREVRRVLREDGTCWICIGDSFSAGKQGRDDGHRRNQQGIFADGEWRERHSGGQKGINHPPPPGYPSGTLLGIPWLVAHAAIADGWVLRDESVWWKDAPMPESVRGSRWQHPTCRCYVRVHPLTPSHAARSPMGVSGGVKTSGLHQSWHTEPRAADRACPDCHGTGRLEEWVLRKGAWRHTRATESVFMLSKTMNYWSDSEAVREAAAPETPLRYMYPFPAYHEGNSDPKGGGFRGAGGVDRQHSPSGRNPRNTLSEPPSAAADLRALVEWLQTEAPEILDAYREAQANPVNVLRPTMSAHGLAHYASFPAALLEPLIKASCPAQCCPMCGDGWAPVIQDEGLVKVSQGGITTRDTRSQPGIAHRASAPSVIRATSVHGYAPTCTHYCTCTPATTASPCPSCGNLPLSVSVPGLVCDPFAGTSTTAQVSRALGRRSVMLDPSWTYIHDLSRERLGLTDLAAWQGEAPPPPPETYDDLPLFAP